MRTTPSQNLRSGRVAITVLLVEDHVMVREGIRALLERQADIVVVGEAGNGRKAVTLTHKLHPDVVVMDVAMPLLNGLEAARQILRICPATKILMLSGYSDDAYVEQSVAVGAAGYLHKQTGSSILPEAIRKLHGGGTFFSQAIAKRQSQQAHKVQAASHVGQPSVHLSSRETEVLQLVAEGKMNKESAEELGISIKTVANHRQSLMNKLSIHDTAGLTRHAISAGLIESGVQTLAAG